MPFIKLFDVAEKILILDVDRAAFIEQIKDTLKRCVEQLNNFSVICKAELGYNIFESLSF